VKKKEKQIFPLWLFSILSICGLMASGIFIGKISVGEYSSIHLTKAIGFGFLGLLMFWGVLTSITTIEINNQNLHEGIEE
jgi:hypothetical protein